MKGLGIDPGEGGGQSLCNGEGETGMGRGAMGRRATGRDGEGRGREGGPEGGGQGWAMGRGRLG